MSTAASALTRNASALVRLRSEFTQALVEQEDEWSEANDALVASVLELRSERREANVAHSAALREALRESAAAAAQREASELEASAVRIAAALGAEHTAALVEMGEAHHLAMGSLEASAAADSRASRSARDESTAAHGRQTRALENSIEELRVEWAQAHAAAEAQCDRLSSALRACEAAIERTHQAHAAETSRVRSGHVEASLQWSGRSRCALAALAAAATARAADSAAAASAAEAAYFVHLQSLGAQSAVIAAELDVARRATSLLAATNAQRFDALRAEAAAAQASAAAERSATEAEIDTAEVERARCARAAAEAAAAREGGLERDAVAEVDAARAAWDAANADALGRRDLAAEQAAAAALERYRLECGAVEDLRRRGATTDVLATTLARNLEVTEQHVEREAAQHARIARALDTVRSEAVEERRVCEQSIRAGEARERAATEEHARVRAALVADHTRALRTAESEISVQREWYAHSEWEHAAAESSAAALAVSLARAEQEHSAWEERAERARNDTLHALRRTEAELATAGRAHLTLATQHDAHVEHSAAAHSALQVEHAQLQRDLDALQVRDGALRSEHDVARAAELHLQESLALLSEELRMERHAAALSAKQIAGQHELARVRSETESESALRAHAARVKDLREDMHALEAQLGERTAALGNARIGAAESELAHAQASQSLRSSVASAEAAVALLRSEAASSVRNERVGAEQCAQETRVAAEQRARYADESVAVTRIRSEAEADMAGAARAIERLNARVAQLTASLSSSRKKVKTARAKHARLAGDHGEHTQKISVELRQRDEEVRVTMNRLLAEREVEFDQERARIVAAHEVALREVHTHSERSWQVRAGAEIESEARRAAFAVDAADAAAGRAASKVEASGLSYRSEQEEAAVLASATLESHELKFASMTQRLRVEVEELHRRDKAMQAERDACLDATKRAAADNARVRAQAKRVRARCEGALREIEETTERKQMLLVLSLSDSQHQLADARARSSPDYLANHQAQQFAAEQAIAILRQELAQKASMESKLRGAEQHLEAELSHEVQAAADFAQLAKSDQVRHDHALDRRVEARISESGTMHAADLSRLETAHRAALSAQEVTIRETQATVSSTRALLFDAHDDIAAAATETAHANLRSSELEAALAEAEREAIALRAAPELLEREMARTTGLLQERAREAQRESDRGHVTLLAMRSELTELERQCVDAARLIQGEVAGGPGEEAAISSARDALDLFRRSGSLVEDLASARRRLEVAAGVGLRNAAQQRVVVQNRNSSTAAAALVVRRAGDGDGGDSSAVARELHEIKKELHEVHAELHATVDGRHEALAAQQRAEACAASAMQSETELQRHIETLRRTFEAELASAAQTSDELLTRAAAEHGAVLEGLRAEYASAVAQLDGGAAEVARVSTVALAAQRDELQLSFALELESACAAGESIAVEARAAHAAESDRLRAECAAYSAEVHEASRGARALAQLRAVATSATLAASAALCGGSSAAHAAEWHAAKVEHEQELSAVAERADASKAALATARGALRRRDEDGAREAAGVAAAAMDHYDAECMQVAAAQMNCAVAEGHARAARAKIVVLEEELARVSASRDDAAEEARATVASESGAVAAIVSRIEEASPSRDDDGTEEEARAAAVRESGVVAATVSRIEEASPAKKKGLSFAGAAALVMEATAAKKKTKTKKRKGGGKKKGKKKR